MCIRTIRCNIHVWILNLMILVVQHQESKFYIYSYHCSTLMTFMSTKIPTSITKMQHQQRHTMTHRSTFVTLIHEMKNNNEGNDDEARSINSDSNTTTVDDDTYYYNDFDENYHTISDDISTNTDTTTFIISSSDPVFYDDFDNQPLIGTYNDGSSIQLPSSSSSSSTTTTILQSRITSIQQVEQRRTMVHSRNWKLGNWFVRGFSLEDDMTTTTSSYTNDNTNSTIAVVNEFPEIGTPTTETALPKSTSTIPSISVIVKSSSSLWRHEEEEDDDDDDDVLDGTMIDDDDEYNTSKNRIDCWIGRTDGSIYGIQFGTDYYTKLGTSSITTEEDNSGSTIPSSAFHDSNDDDMKYEDDFDELSPPTEVEEVGTPFRIVTQFKGPSSNAITSIVAIPSGGNVINKDDDGDYDNDNTTPLPFDIYTASTLGELQHWVYDGLSLPKIKNTLSSLDVTTSSIIKLKYIITKKTRQMKRRRMLLLSVTETSITIWDVQTDTILGYVHTITLPSSDPGEPQHVITCIDSDDTFIYLGTKSGYIVVYAIDDILLGYNSSSSTISIDPVGYWRVSPSDSCSVSAIQCGGPGILGRRASTTTTKSTIVYTGDDIGSVKLWEVLQMKRPSTMNDDNSSGDINNRKQQYRYKVEAWPKLATQRLQKRAHVFKGHYNTITSILSVDTMKFVSASADGTVRAWNTATGKEMFCMDGFSDPIRSLCLLDGEYAVTTGNIQNHETSERLRDTILVTDGMNKYVCVHDFSADDEDVADYDLEMPEYIN